MPTLLPAVRAASVSVMRSVCGHAWDFEPAQGACCANQLVSVRCAYAGFRVIEMGAGTGCLTGQAYPMLNEGANSELLQYTCTDISDSAASKIQNVVRAPNVGFKVTLKPL